MTETATITGTITRIMYSRDGFSIFQIAGPAERTACKGQMLDPEIGIEYELTGRWTEHHQFGRQFQFETYKPRLPVDGDAVVGYLARSLEGVGPSIARAMVDAYGEKTLDVLADDPERVAEEIRGVKVEHAREIAKRIRSLRDTADAEIELRRLCEGCRVPARVISRIVQDHGSDAPVMARKHPYELARRYSGVGFTTADRIAKNGGEIATDSPARVEAGIIHELEEAAQGGDCYLPCSELIQRAGELLSLEAAHIARGIGSGSEWFIEVDGNAWLKSLLYAEVDVAESLAALAEADVDPVVVDEDVLSSAAEDQRAAITGALESPVAVITGAPGTGKTWTISAILEALSGRRVELCAPTGKAAKRITEQTHRPAQTIHRLLGPAILSSGELGFERGEGNPIRATAVVVDEVSMVDVRLMSALLGAISAGTRLLLVGDTNQLPSVGPGAVLRDVIDSGVIPSFELTKIKRQDAGDIIQNCHRIKAGQSIEFPQGSPDFFVSCAGSVPAIRSEVLSLVSERIPRHTGLSAVRGEIQVISPRKASVTLSCADLNPELQKRVNENAEVDGSPFRLGDRVIQTSNDYERGIVNGDAGYVEAINTTRTPMRLGRWVVKPRTLLVRFDGLNEIVELPAVRNNLELAYALTCHKAQGSEYPIVVIPIHSSFGSRLLQRSWIYTAISRASRMVVIVGQIEEVDKAIGRTRQARRATRLAIRLREKREQYHGAGAAEIGAGA